MPIKEFTVFKNKLRSSFPSIVVLASILLLLPGINKGYALAQEGLSIKKNPKVKIIEERMQRLKSRIWKWEERIRKRPFDIFPRSERIGIMQKYIEWSDKLENELNNNPLEINTYEKKIKLVKEKKKFSINLKDDYIQCIDLNIKELHEIDRILLFNPEGITTISIQLFNAEDLTNRLNRIKEELSRSIGIRSQAEEVSERISNRLTFLVTTTRIYITREISQNMQWRRDYNMQWDEKILGLETKLFKIKKNFIQLLTKKIRDREASEDITPLKEKLPKLLDACIQHLEEKLKENPGDTTLMEELEELKDKRARIEVREF